MCNKIDITDEWRLFTALNDDKVYTFRDEDGNQVQTNQADWPEWEFLIRRKQPAESQFKMSHDDAQKLLNDSMRQMVDNIATGGTSE